MLIFFCGERGITCMIPKWGGLSEEKPAAHELERDYSLSLVVSHSIATLLLMQVLWLGSNPWGFSSALSPGEQKKTRLSSCCFFCGERGIRTPGPVTVNSFQDCRIRPLCHFSNKMLPFSGCECKYNCFFWLCKSIWIKNASILRSLF